MKARLEQVALYPVKSTAVRRVHAATVEPWGLRGDRRWMVATPDGECLTAREEHRLLALIADTPETAPGLGAALRLRRTGLEDLEVAEPGGPEVPVTVHGRALTGRHSEPGVGEWLGRALDRAELSLVHVATPRRLDPALTQPGEATAFADAYPVTLASAASLRRLQDWVLESALERAENPVDLDIARFRPNLVVDGDLEPFEEDTWRTVQVGAVTFRVLKPVDRCVMTTLDPLTLAGGHEPIRTLARHRSWDGATWFAVQLVPETVGEIHLGDDVRPVR